MCETRTGLHLIVDLAGADTASLPVMDSPCQRMELFNFRQPPADLGPELQFRHVARPSSRCRRRKKNSAGLWRQIALMSYDLAGHAGVKRHHRVWALQAAHGANHECCGDATRIDGHHCVDCYPQALRPTAASRQRCPSAGPSQFSHRLWRGRRLSPTPNRSRTALRGVPYVTPAPRIRSPQSSGGP